MKKTAIAGLAAVAALALLFTIGCEKGGGTSGQPATVAAPAQVSASNPVASTPEVPAATPTETDPCADDASCGKGLEMEFDSELALVVTSTNTGHNNSGVVCATNGFSGPNLAPGATPYPWSVLAQSTSVTPFPKGRIEELMEWPEGLCEQTIKTQLDAYRGPLCQGKILAVAWPQDNPVTYHKPIGDEVVSEWAVTETSEWGECSSDQGQHDEVFWDDEANLSASTEEQRCYQYRTMTKERTRTRECSAEIQTERVTRRQRRECKCPCGDEFTWTARNTGIIARFVIRDGSKELWSGWLYTNQSVKFVYNKITTISLYRERYGPDELLDQATSETCSGKQETDLLASTYHGDISVTCACVVPGAPRDLPADTLFIE